MRLKIWLLLGYLLQCLSAAPLHAQGTQTEQPVIMGVHHFPPDFIVSPDGKTCGGSGVEQTRKILASAGLQLETTCVPPARLYLLLKHGDIDLTINIKSTTALQSNPAPVFVEPAYLNLQLALFSHKPNSQAPRDRSVALIRAFDYHGQRQQLSRDGFLLIDLPDAPSAIEMFVHQRTQHLLTYEGPFKAYLSSQQHASLSQYNHRAIATIPTYFVISAQSTQRQRIVSALEQYAAAHRCRLFVRCGSP